MWVQQKCLAFDCFADYITCIHFAAFPGGKETLYVGCNNGLVMCADVTALSRNRGNDATSSASSVDVSPVLSLLYRHQHQQRHENKSSTGKNNTNSKANTEESAVFDEAAGSTVFAISRFETVFATCADDGRCIISLTDSHPSFSASSPTNPPPPRLDQLRQMPRGVCQLDSGVVAVIEQNSGVAVRAVTLFGGKAEWSKNSEDEEASAVYAALGCEDGMVRVYRIDVGDAMSRQYAVNNSTSNDWASIAACLDSACQLMWVVSVSSSTSSTSYVCSMVFDSAAELLLVGTQHGCCLIDCLPNSPTPRCGSARDTDVAATADSWLASSVWALSGHELSSSSAAAIPLRSLKPKYFNHFRGGRSIGTVVDIAVKSSPSSETAAAAAAISVETTTATNTMLQVMFLGLKKESVALPQSVLRRVEKPRCFLAVAGGPFFAVATVTSQQQQQRRRFLIAGAAASGEVCLVECRPEQQQHEQVVLLCKFTAGTDIIKHMTLLPTSFPSFFVVLCASYDGTVSEWVLGNSSSGDEEEEEERVTAMRRSVTLVASAVKQRTTHQQHEGNDDLKVSHKLQFPLLLQKMHLDLKQQFAQTSNNGEINDDDNAAAEDVDNADDTQTDPLATHRSTGVAAMHLFPEAGVLFASCLFERAVQSFIAVPTQGCELPPGFFFNGRKSVRVVDKPDCARSVPEIPSDLLRDEEARRR